MTMQHLGAAATEGNPDLNNGSWNPEEWEDAPLRNWRVNIEGRIAVVGAASGWDAIRHGALELLTKEQLEGNWTGAARCEDDSIACARAQNGEISMPFGFWFHDRADSWDSAYGTRFAADWKPVDAAAAPHGDVPKPYGMANTPG